MMPLSATSWPIECAGERHQLVWRDGELLVPDHPDPERELALTALGGDGYRCLQLRQVWLRHTEDLDVLLLASRGPADQVAAPVGIAIGRGPRRLPRRPGRGTSVGWFSYSPLTSSSTGRVGAVHTHDGPADDPPGLADVLRLGGGLPDRLVAQVIQAWSGRSAGPALPRLHAALYGRFAAVVRQWLGDPALPIGLTMAAADEPPALVRTDRSLDVRLSFGWLAEVWILGLAIVADRLCLAVLDHGSGGYELDTLGRDLASRATVTLEVG